MTQTMIVTSATMPSWQKALQRAIAEALDVYVSTDGTAFVESSSRPGLLYQVSREGCSCPAGEREIACKHRACFLAQIGELELQNERISFFGDSDRQEVRIDGRFFGNALFTNDGGWQLYRGAFPRARRMGAYRTLEEIRTDLMARMPVAIPVQPPVQVVSAIAETAEMASVA